MNRMYSKEFKYVKYEFENLFPYINKDFLRNIKYLYAYNQEYHNFNHAISVTYRAIINKEYVNLSKIDKKILIVSCLFHDAGHNKNNTEKLNLLIAYNLFLNSEISYYFTDKQKNIIKETIYATDNRNLSAYVTNKLGKIIRDADITQTLVDDDWMIRLAKESNLPISRESTKLWLEDVMLLTESGRLIKDDFLNK